MSIDDELKAWASEMMDPADAARAHAMIDADAVGAAAALRAALNLPPLMTPAECEQFALDMIDAAGLDIGSGLTAEQIGRAYGRAIHQAQIGRPELPGVAEALADWPSAKVNEVISRLQDQIGPYFYSMIRTDNLMWRGTIEVVENGPQFQALADTPEAALEGALALARSAKGAA